MLVSLALGILWHAVAGTPKPESDALLYHWLASAIAGLGVPGQTLRYAVDGMAIRGWTQPSLMAGTYAVVGQALPAVFAWLQGVVMIPATTALVYVAGRFAFDRTVGLVAAWAFALWFPLVYYTTWLMPETTVGLVVAGCLALLAVLIARGGTAVAIAFGIALGILSLTHSAWQFVPVVTIGALALHFRLYDRSHLRLAAWTAIGAVAIVGPYTIAQTAADLPQAGQGGLGYGAGGGWGFWVGSRSWTHFLPVADDYKIANLNAPGGVVKIARLLDDGKLHTDSHLARVIRRKASAPDAATAQIADGDFYDAGIQNLLEHPGAWPDKLYGGLKTIFLPTPDLTFFAARLATPNLTFFAAPVDATWFRRPWRSIAPWVAGLMLAGILLVLVRMRNRLVLFVPLLLQTVLFLSGTPETRYGYPLLSSVFLLASYAVVSALRGLGGLVARRNYSLAP